MAHRVALSTFVLRLAGVALASLALQCKGERVSVVSQDGSGGATAEGTRTHGSAGGAAGGGATGGGGSGGSETGSGGSGGNGGSLQAAAGAPATSGSGGAASGGAASNTTTTGGSTGDDRCSMCNCEDGLCRPELVWSGGVWDFARGGVGLSDDRLYFIIEGNYDLLQLLSVAKHGGSPTLLYEQENCSSCPPLSLAVDQQEVFFFRYDTGFSLEAIDKTGSDPSLRRVNEADSGIPRGLLRIDDLLYWTEFGSGVYRAPTANGAREFLANSSDNIIALAGSSERLVWATLDAGAHALDLQTMQTTFLGQGSTPSSELCDVALDEGVAYWIDCGFPYAVFREGMAEPLAEATASQPEPGLGFDRSGSLAIDSKWVYFLEYGKLNRVAIGGGAVTPIAWTEDQTIIAANEIVAIDATHVYLHSEATARVFRVPK